jgi:membrane protein YdbS with pleckstrin-like domain
MYKPFCDVCERWLRIPAAPEPPPGDEHTTQIFRAAPNYFKYLLVLWAIRTGVLVLAFGFGLIAIIVATFVSKHQIGFAIYPMVFVELAVFAFFLLTQLVSLAIVRLDYEKRWYVVTDRSLRVREGILNVQEMTVNFANIQNISISQGPIQRMLQIADLKVDTAGGGGSVQPQGHHQMRNLHTAFFRGVSNAGEIRELIQSRLRHLKDSGLGDHEEVAAVHAQGGKSALIAALREVHGESVKLNAALRVG